MSTARCGTSTRDPPKQPSSRQRFDPLLLGLGHVIAVPLEVVSGAVS